MFSVMLLLKIVLHELIYRSISEKKTVKSMNALAEYWLAVRRCLLFADSAVKSSDKFWSLKY